MTPDVTAQIIVGFMLASTASVLVYSIYVKCKTVFKTF